MTPDAQWLMNGHQLDLTAPDVVQVQMNEEQTVLWVNVDGVCALRICQMKPGDITFDLPGPISTV